MTIRYDLAMHHAFAGRQYGCVGDKYEDINWYEETPKPTKKELEAIWKSIEGEHITRDRNHKRQMSYPSTDELVVALWEKFVEQRPEADLKLIELQNRRQAVKELFPKV